MALIVSAQKIKQVRNALVNDCSTKVIALVGPPGSGKRFALTSVCAEESIRLEVVTGETCELASLAGRLNSQATRIVLFAQICSREELECISSIIGFRLPYVTIVVSFNDMMYSVRPDWCVIKFHLFSVRALSKLIAFHANIECVSTAESIAETANGDARQVINELRSMGLYREGPPTGSDIKRISKRKARDAKVTNDRDTNRARDGTSPDATDPTDHAVAYSFFHIIGKVLYSKPAASPSLDCGSLANQPAVAESQSSYMAFKLLQENFPDFISDLRDQTVQRAFAHMCFVDAFLHSPKHLHALDSLEHDTWYRNYLVFQSMAMCEDKAHCTIKGFHTFRNAATIVPDANRLRIMDKLRLSAPWTRDSRTIYLLDAIMRLSGGRLPNDWSNEAKTWVYQFVRGIPISEGEPPCTCDDPLEEVH